MNSVYQINKGINKPIEFRGLKAQYIAYLGIGLVCLLLLFAILYIAGVSIFICIVIVGGLGMLLFSYVYKCSHKYGRYGLMKKSATRNVPCYIRFHSRKIFTGLNAKQ